MLHDDTYMTDDFWLDKSHMMQLNRLVENDL